MYAINVNLELDRRFAMMEHRGLQFLLQGRELELYREFLDKPIEYQRYIRAQVEHDKWFLENGR